MYIEYDKQDNPKIIGERWSAICNRTACFNFTYEGSGLCAKHYFRTKRKRQFYMFLPRLIKSWLTVKTVAPIEVKTLRSGYELGIYEG